MGLDLNSAAPSVQFHEPGDSVTGVVLEAEEIDQTDMETGELVYWDEAKTRVKRMPAIKLDAPGHRDADENGHVTLYASGGRYTALKAATRRVDEGATLTMTFTAYSDQAPKVRGYNRAKRYTASYTPPVKGVDLGGPAAPAAPAAQSAPAHHATGTPPF